MSAEAAIALYERNATVRRRICRAVCAGADLMPVAAADAPSPERPTGRPVLIAAGLELLANLEPLVADLPFTNVVMWGTRNEPSLLRLARSDRRWGHFVAWPEFASMPRAIDLVATTRRLVHPRAQLGVRGLLMPHAAERTFHPSATSELENVVSAIRSLSLDSGAGTRLAERIAVVAHELLMNAMYVAPVEADGLPKYAHDRKNAIRLLDNEIPKITFATDGLRIGIQVTDPYGRLERDHVFRGVCRGLETQDAADALDTRRGGAGLGLYRVFDAAHALFIDVRHGRTTAVTTMFDLDISARDQRNMPTTLCFFED